MTTNETTGLRKYGAMPSLLKPLGLGLGLALASGITGCVTNGKDFRSDVSWIHQGQTKKSDAEMLLGEPYAVGTAPGGKPVWTYGYYRYKLIGKSMQKELKLYWKPDGSVETFSFNSSFPEDLGGQAPAPIKAP